MENINKEGLPWVYSPTVPMTGIGKLKSISECFQGVQAVSKRKVTVNGGDN